MHIYIYNLWVTQVEALGLASAASGVSGPNSDGGGSGCTAVVRMMDDYLVVSTDKYVNLVYNVDMFLY